MGLCPQNDVDEIVKLLKDYGLPTECPFSADSLAEIALSDKKRKGDKIDLIVPFGIGHSQIYPINVNELEAFFAKGL